MFRKNFASLLPIYIHTDLPVLVYFTLIYSKMVLTFLGVPIILPFQVLSSRNQIAVT